jgi:hypothetical protein
MYRKTWRERNIVEQVALSGNVSDFYSGCSQFKIRLGRGKSPEIETNIMSHVV